MAVAQQVPQQGGGQGDGGFQRRALIVPRAFVRALIKVQRDDDVLRDPLGIFRHGQFSGPGRCAPVHPAQLIAGAVLADAVEIVAVPAHQSICPAVPARRRRAPQP